MSKKNKRIFGLETGICSNCMGTMKTLIPKLKANNLSFPRINPDICHVIVLCVIHKQDTFWKNTLEPRIIAVEFTRIKRSVCHTVSGIFELHECPRFLLSKHDINQSLIRFQPDFVQKIFNWSKFPPRLDFESNL